MSLRPLDRPVDPLSRALDVTPVRLVLFVALGVWAFWNVFRVPLHGGSTLDWQFFQFFDEIARKTILDYGQFPIWNPYFCGGTPMIGNPQTTFLVPTFPLVLAFGTTFGMRLSSLVVIIVGCEGCYRLLRHLGAEPLPSVLAAVAYPLFGRTLGWLTDGQHGLHAISLAGWIFYGWLRGMDEPRYLVVGGAFFAWLLAYRGIEPGPQLALGMVVWAAFEIRRRIVERRPFREVVRPLTAGAVVGLLGAGFIGIRMVGVMANVLQHPRIVVETKMNHLTGAMFETFALWPGTKGFGAPGYAYIGLVTYLCFWGAVLFRRARARAAVPIAGAFFFFILILGMHGEFSIYPWLKKLPLYQSLRNPTLYTFIGALFLVVSGALGLDELLRWIRERKSARARRAGVALVAVAVLGTGVELASLCRGFTASNPFRFEPLAAVDDDFRQSRGNHFVHPIWPTLQRGTLSCYDETPWPASGALRPDLPAEEYLVDATAGTVRRAKWTPNKIVVEYDLQRPATLVVNQNWYQGWSASVGKAHPRDGLLAVDLPAGRGAVSIRMWPLSATVGLFGMVLAIAASWWLVRRDRARQRTGTNSGESAPSAARGG